jgi:hypothetical protein
MFYVVAALPGSPAGLQARVWHHLWQLRDVPSVSVVLPTIVSSPCPLLADEPADAVCSTSGLQVPQETAWVPLEVDLVNYLDGDGNIRLPRLEHALRRSVERGDARHRHAQWGRQSLTRDSRLNRRLAIAIRGWGSIVARRGDDPHSFATLRRLEELADFVGATLRSHSQKLARERGYCPALDIAGAPVQESSAEMKARWRRAVAANAIRHRNLSMMSPWDVFPADAPADLRYADLLPLLRCADCLSFRRSVDISHWNPNEFRGFYERVGAVLQRRNDAGSIAKRV